MKSLFDNDLGPIELVYTETQVLSKIFGKAKTSARMGAYQLMSEGGLDWPSRAPAAAVALTEEDMDGHKKSHPAMPGHEEPPSKSAPLHF